MYLSPIETPIKQRYSKQTPFVIHGSGRPGQTGVPVVAPVSGTVRNVVNNRKPGQPSTRGKTVRGGISGNGLEIVTASKERVVLAHLKTSLKGGDRVQAGDVVGFTDRSGEQPFGPCLFFAVIDPSGNPIDPGSWVPGRVTEPETPDLSLPADDLADVPVTEGIGDGADIPRRSGAASVDDVLP